MYLTRATKVVEGARASGLLPGTTFASLPHVDDDWERVINLRHPVVSQRRFGRDSKDCLIFVIESFRLFPSICGTRYESRTQGDGTTSWDLSPGNVGRGETTAVGPDTCERYGITELDNRLGHRCLKVLSRASRVPPTGRLSD